MRLGILSPSTCVGLRYGHPDICLEVFLGSMELPTLWPGGLDITPRSWQDGGFAYRPLLHA